MHTCIVLRGSHCGATALVCWLQPNVKLTKQPLQVVTSADVFGIYMEGVQQHLDDAFANKGHPGDSPQFPAPAPGPFASNQPASQPAPKQPPATAVPAAPSSTQQLPAAAPAPATTASASAGSAAGAATAAIVGAEPVVQDQAAPSTAAAPAVNHVPDELPPGAAHDAAAATATHGVPTAIVPSDGDAVIEGEPAPPADKSAEQSHGARGRLLVVVLLLNHAGFHLTCSRSTAALMGKL